MAANKPERQGGNNVNGGHKIPAERYAAARALYEATPGMSMAKLSDETGIGKSNLERRANTEGWVKNFATVELGGMSGAAQQIADSYNTKLADYGPEVTDEQRDIVSREVVVEVATDLRGQLIDRHRREWGAVRKLAYESMTKRDFELAKLAKISSETLFNVQNAERKAWGIDKPDGETKLTVVIDRGD